MKKKSFKNRLSAKFDSAIQLKIVFQVTLKGSRECIDMAKQKIESTVEDLKSMVTINCIIPQKHHRIVMGVKGTKVQLITSEYNVQINFPERDSHGEW